MKTAVKEYPIGFTAHMMRAIRADMKTQTRRKLKTQPPAWWSGDTLKPVLDSERLEWRLDGWSHRSRCGPLGSRLWCKESYGIFRGSGEVVYAADCSPLYSPTGSSNPMKSGRFMPRRYARQMLERTAGRLERLQALTEADAIAEGAGLDAIVQDLPFGQQGVIGFLYPDDRLQLDVRRKRAVATAVEWYALLWDKINPKMPWRLNPLVEVMEFKRV